MLHCSTLIKPGELKGMLDFGFTMHWVLLMISGLDSLTAIPGRQQYHDAGMYYGKIVIVST